MPALDEVSSKINGHFKKYKDIDYKNSVLPVIWASQDGANVIMIIVNAKVDPAIL